MIASDYTCIFKVVNPNKLNNSSFPYPLTIFPKRHIITNKINTNTMKKLATLILLILTTSLLSGCGEAPEQKDKVLREEMAKEVTIFDLSEDKADLNFSKTGTTKAENTVYISPQIAGRVKEILVSVGDSVYEGEVLIFLGDSLSTDANALQYEAAVDAANIAAESLDLTYEMVEQSIAAAESGLRLSEEAYTLALQTRENSDEIYDQQLKSARAGLESAQDGVESAEEALEDIDDAIDDLEDELYDTEELLELDPTNADLLALESQLEDAIDALKTQEDAAELQLSIAENGVSQAEAGVDLVKANRTSQLDQLNFSVTSAYEQYTLAYTQLETTLASTELQKLGAESQLAQAESGRDLAKLSKDSANITSPIDGVITSISAEEGNLTSPGQIIAKVEDADGLIIATSVNQFEAELLRSGDKVEITTDSGKITEGEIEYISPAANEISKKIDVEISINNDDEILAESFVKINFAPSAKKRIFVPLNSINQKDGQHFVKTVDDNLIVNISVETGKIVGKYIEVLGGLSGKEKIIMATTSFIE
jgi:RND family efflux transporter MFP subunit